MADWSMEALVGEFGDLDFPVTTSITTTLTPLDPARERLTALFKAAINAELGTAWTTVTNTLDSGHALYGTSPVQDTLELAPSPAVMTQRKPAWPLMCVYRSGKATLEPFTMHIDRIVQEWTVDYILGPLDVGDLRKVGDVCIAVAKIIRAVIRRRGHASYDSGALQFFPDKGGLGAIELKSSEGPGQASFAGDESGTLYYALTMTLETVEHLTDDADEFGAFDAIDFEVGVGSGDGIVPGLIYASTDVPIVNG